MSKMLATLGTLISLSVAATTLQFWTAVLTKTLSARLRWASHISQGLNLMVWSAHDHGNSLASHGAYNMLIFGLILLPVNITITLTLVWFRLAAGPAAGRRSKRFWVQFAAASTVVSLVVLVTARVKQRNLDYGFFNKRISSLAFDSVEQSSLRPCQWEEAVPWFDLVPFRLNFFTGSMACATEDDFQASFSSAGELTVECDAKETIVKSDVDGSIIGRFQGAAYSILPRTENWGLTLKNDSLTANRNDLQWHVIQYAESHTRLYQRPIKLGNDVDTVLVRCGDAPHQIVNRISEPLESAQVIAKRRTQPPEDGLNVVVIFLDAVSRPQFHRRLPKTRHLLERFTKREEAQSTLFELTRYHTVGMNTRPNTRALWAGLSTPGENAAANSSEEHRPPIWEQFEAAGYTSARVDPMCQDWTTYYDTGHMRSKNFSDKFQSFISHEYLAWSCFPPYLPVGAHFAGNFAGATSIKARCTSGTHVSWHELAWCESFLHHYAQPNSRRPVFLISSFMEGHEGSGEVLHTIDERLARFLDPATGPIDYKSTAVLIVSDHGALMGLNYAFLKNGKIEASNPFAAFVLPKGYLEQGTRAQNIYSAQAKLVTAFDLYETLRGFMGVPVTSTTASRWKGREAAAEQLGCATKKPIKGFDLVRQDPGLRTCEAAGVPESACRCR